jgi:hypothetical protein
VGQRSGRSAVNAEIVGFNSHQSRQDLCYGSVAQMSERLPLKQEDVGCNPTRSTRSLVTVRLNVTTL